MTTGLTLDDLQRPARAVPRLADVARLGLDREAERPYLRDIVDEVAVRLDAPFALVDVLLNTAQIFIAEHGERPEWLLESGGTPMEWAFCLPMMTTRAPHAVADFAADPLFRDSPLVTVVGLRSYAGAPLISHAGHVLGGLCVLDVKPRRFGPEELLWLQERAAEAVERIEERAAGD
ncbi:GAF domain-containing protein [Actinoplanes sp. CA-030573]|uniref:GAF domain-containing protein n=1 Tax=Actinoplanes sp. CA-030573 TaxID=3239898 RepID=UPI003D933423